MKKISDIVFWVAIGIVVLVVLHFFAAMHIRVNGEQCRTLLLKPILRTECTL